MKVTVRFFASVREVVGEKSQTVDLAEGATVASLWQKYVESFPRLAKMNLGFAVNHQYMSGDKTLSEGDEVAFIPPVSGG